MGTCQSYIILCSSSYFHSVTGTSEIPHWRFENIPMSHTKNKRKAPEEAAVDEDSDLFFPANAKRVSVNKAGFIELGNIPGVHSFAHDLI